MADGREIIRTLEGELQVTQERCAVLERTIAGLREVYGVADGEEDADDETPARTRRGGKRKYTRRKKAAKKAERTNERTNEARRAPAPGGTFDRAQGQHQQDILASLKKAGGSIKPGDLMTAVGANNLATLRYWMTPLLEHGDVVATGKTAGRRFSLKGHVPKEEL